MIFKFNKLYTYLLLMVMSGQISGMELSNLVSKQKNINEELAADYEFFKNYVLELKNKALKKGHNRKLIENLYLRCMELNEKGKSTSGSRNALKGLKELARTLTNNFKEREKIKKEFKEINFKESKNLHSISETRIDLVEPQSESKEFYLAPVEGNNQISNWMNDCFFKELLINKNHIDLFKLDFIPDNLFQDLRNFEQSLRGIGNKEYASKVLLNIIKNFGLKIDSQYIIELRKIAQIKLSFFENISDEHISADKSTNLKKSGSKDKEESDKKLSISKKIDNIGFDKIEPLGKLLDSNHKIQDIKNNKLGNNFKLKIAALITLGLFSGYKFPDKIKSDISLLINYIKNCPAQFKAYVNNQLELAKLKIRKPKNKNCDKFAYTAADIVT